MIIDLKELISTHRLNVHGVIHIGVGQSEEIPIYQSCGINRILMFDPLYISLEKVNGVNILPFAIGEEDKMVDMYVSQPNTASSSLVKPKKRLRYYPDITYPNVKRVPVRALDSFKTYGYNLLNMDVHGYEREIFNGATITMNWIDYIYMEVNFDELWENCPLVDEIDNLLSDFVRVETKMTKYGWGDALYIRTKDIAGNIIRKAYNDEKPLRITAELRPI